MFTLALDVDGVLLDSDRGGAGRWSVELERKHGVSRAQLREHFFVPCWDDVVNGRRPIESALGESLRLLGSSVSVEDVLACWFAADFVLFEPAINLARCASAHGIRVVLATNQEHRRAAYLREHLEKLFSIDAMLYSADLGVQKHEPTFFALASQRLRNDDGSRSRVLFVDDLDVNVQQARKSGWEAVHATPDQRWIAEVLQRLDLPTS